MGRLTRQFILCLIVVVFVGCVVINRQVVFEQVLVPTYVTTSTTVKHLKTGISNSPFTQPPFARTSIASLIQENSTRLSPAVLNASSHRNETRPRYYFEFNTIFENKSICHDDPEIVLSVFSAPADFCNRAVLRQTWAKSLDYMGVKVRVVFLLGRQLDWLYQSQIEAEGEKYGDILQHDFIDSYRNLSLKRLASIEWQARRCPNTYWTVKADDDLFVNRYRLIEFYHYYREHKLSGFYCSVLGRSRVLRAGKWKVSVEEYPDKFYPPYCLGLLTICTLNESLRLYEAAKTSKLLWVEDAFTAGVLRVAAGVSMHGFLQQPPFIAQWNINPKRQMPNVRNSIVLNKRHRKEHDLWFQFADILNKTFATSS